VSDYQTWWIGLGRAAPNVRIVLVTPELASAWLERNIKNRTFKEYLCVRYMEALLRGEWMLNGEPIIFDTTGRLVSGQHRLTACVRAGVGFETYVVFDAEPAFSTIDQGRSRTSGDTLSLSGITNASDVSAAIHFIAFHDSDEPRPTSQFGARLTAAFKARFAETHPEIQDSVRAAKRSGAPIPRACMSAVHFIGARYSRRAADDYLEAMHTGAIGGDTLPQTNAILRFREAMLGRQIKGAGLKSDFAFPYACHAWNLWTEGREVKQFKFLDFERAPRITAAPSTYTGRA